MGSYVRSALPLFHSFRCLAPAGHTKWNEVALPSVLPTKWRSFFSFSSTIVCCIEYLWSWSAFVHRMASPGKHNRCLFMRWTIPVLSYNSQNVSLEDSSNVNIVHASIPYSRPRKISDLKSVHLGRGKTSFQLRWYNNWCQCWSLVKRNYLRTWSYNCQQWRRNRVANAIFVCLMTGVIFSSPRSIPNRFAPFLSQAWRKQK